MHIPVGTSLENPGVDKDPVVQISPSVCISIRTAKVEGFAMGENGRCVHPLFARPAERKADGHKVHFSPLETHIPS